MKGRLLIIPTVISEAGNKHLSPSVIHAIHQTKHWIVERARTARRFIKSTDPPYEINELSILEIETKDKQSYDLKALTSILDSGHDLGLLSESGCPGVADPGALIIQQLQSLSYQVVPFVGPSSILLSLMASGMNGQQFEFHGYLPIKENELKKTIKTIELKAQKTKSTQIFIETPYRNDRMLKFLCTHLNANSRLCIASDITGQGESIITRSIKAWKNSNHIIGKTPTVFLINV